MPDKKEKKQVKLVECSACKGTGEITEPEFAGANGKCRYCGGSGEVEVKK